MAKKDLNYIAALEKAIAKKYGEDTIQNPKANWDEEKEKDYLEQLKVASKKEREKKSRNEKVEVDGFLVSKQLLNRETSRTCPVCKAYSFDIQDDVYMLKYKCCRKCYFQWVDGREERWEKGWRPSPGDIKKGYKTVKELQKEKKEYG